MSQEVNYYGLFSNSQWFRLITIIGGEKQPDEEGWKPVCQATATVLSQCAKSLQSWTTFFTPGRSP